MRLVLGALTALALASSASAQTACDYNSDRTRQICYDLSNPNERSAYIQERADEVKRAHPQPGILTGPIPIKEMLSTPNLALPDNVNFTIMRVDRIIDGNTIEGAVDYKPERVKFANLNVDAEHNQTAMDVLKFFLPVGSVVYIEFTGKYDEKGMRSGFIWQTSNLLNVILVERGLATPTHFLPRYSTELDVAYEFSKRISAAAPAKSQP